MKEERYKKMSFVPVLLALFLVLSGCIKISVYEKIGPDGYAEQTLSMDMSKFYSLMVSVNESVTQKDFDTEMEKTLCPNLTTGGNYSSCSVKNGIVEAKTTKLKLTEKDGFKKQEGFFETLYIYNATKFLNESNEKISNYQNSSISALKLSGVEFIYTIEMPGEIIETNGNKIAINKAEFDLLEFSSKNSAPYVKSKETHILSYAIVVGLVIIIILVAYYLIIKRRSAVQ